MQVKGLIFLLLAAAYPARAGAETWVRHIDERLGYAIELPSNYVAADSPDDAGTEAFRSADSTETLTLSGGTVLPGSFDSVWERTLAGFSADGWSLSYDPAPPNWTSFSGERGARSVFVKMIPLCGGTRDYAMLAFEYPAAEAARLAPLVAHLAGSLRASGTGLSC